MREDAGGAAGSRRDGAAPGRCQRVCDFSAQCCDSEPGKRMSHAELPRPVTAGKRSHLLSRPRRAIIPLLLPPRLPLGPLQEYQQPGVRGAGEAVRESKRGGYNRIWRLEKKVPVFNCCSVLSGRTQPGQQPCFQGGFQGPAPPVPVPPGRGGSVDLTLGLHLFLFAEPLKPSRGRAGPSDVPVTQGNPPLCDQYLSGEGGGGWWSWASPTCGHPPPAGSPGRWRDTDGLSRGLTAAGKSPQARETVFPFEQAVSFQQTSEIQMGSEIPLL